MRQSKEKEEKRKEKRKEKKEVETRQMHENEEAWTLETLDFGILDGNWKGPKVRLTLPIIPINYHQPARISCKTLLGAKKTRLLLLFRNFAKGQHCRPETQLQNDWIRAPHDHQLG